MRLAVNVPDRAALGWVDRSAPDRRSRSGTEIGPGLQIIERINDAAADLAVLRPRSVGAMLLERAAERPRNRAASGVRRKRGGSRQADQA